MFLSVMLVIYCFHAGAAFFRLLHSLIVFPASKISFKSSFEIQDNFQMNKGNCYN